MGDRAIESQKRRRKEKVIYKKKTGQARGESELQRRISKRGQQSASASSQKETHQNSQIVS